MGYQYLSLPQGPGALPVQGEYHTIRPTVSSETPTLWDQRLPEWQYYLVNMYRQV